MAAGVRIIAPSTVNGMSVTRVPTVVPAAKARVRTKTVRAHRSRHRPAAVPARDQVPATKPIRLNVNALKVVAEDAGVAVVVVAGVRKAGRRRTGRTSTCVTMLLSQMVRLTGRHGNHSPHAKKRTRRRPARLVA